MDRNKYPSVRRYIFLNSMIETQSGYIVDIGLTKRTARRIVLSKNGADLLGKCDGTKTISEILSNYDVSVQMSAEVFLRGLVDDGIIDLSEQTGNIEDRYDRHRLYYSMLGLPPEETQEQLKCKTVALLGVGGIGSWVAYGLACLGIGRIVLVDGDHVEKSNLTRQILFSETDIGSKKVYCAARRLQEFNSDMICDQHHTYLTCVDEVLNVIRGSDFVVLSADKPTGQISQIVASACRSLRIPHTVAGYADACGVSGPIVLPQKQDCVGVPELVSPNDCDASKRHPLGELLKRRFQAPSFGPLNAFVSAYTVLEVFRFFCLQNSVTERNAYIVDSVSMERQNWN